MPIMVCERATHARRGIRESRGISDSVRAIVHRTVAVQVPAHCVQLRQGANLDQAVAVGIVRNRGFNDLWRSGQKDGAEYQPT